MKNKIKKCKIFLINVMFCDNFDIQFLVKWVEKFLILFYKMIKNFIFYN